MRGASVLADGEAAGPPTAGSGPEELGPEAGAEGEPGVAPESEEAPEVEDGPEEEGAIDETEGASAAAAARPTVLNPVRHQTGKEIRQALLRETVAYVRNPANGISPEVGITNGFASETPFPSGAAAPIGLTALSKHPYAGGRMYPASYPVNNIYPLNALGERDSAAKGVSRRPCSSPATRSSCRSTG